MLKYKKGDMVWAVVYMRVDRFTIQIIFNESRYIYGTAQDDLFYEDEILGYV